MNIIPYNFILTSSKNITLHYTLQSEKLTFKQFCAVINTLRRVDNGLLRSLHFSCTNLLLCVYCQAAQKWMKVSQQNCAKILALIKFNFSINNLYEITIYEMIMCFLWFISWLFMYTFKCSAITSANIVATCLVIYSHFNQLIWLRSQYGICVYVLLTK